MNEYEKKVLNAAATCMSRSQYEYFCAALDAGRAYAVVTRAKTDRGIARAVIKAFAMNRDTDAEEIFEVANGTRSLRSILGNGYCLYTSRTVTLFVMRIL